MGILQFSLIRPYYRDTKINSLKSISVKLQDLLLVNDYIEDYQLKQTTKYISDNNVCAIIFNDQGDLLFDIDSLGNGCMLDQEISFAQKTIIPKHEGIEINSYLADNNEFTMELTNNYTNLDMVMYGEKVQGNLSNYYIYLNTPIEPVDSLVLFFKTQYISSTLIILGVSILLALYIAKKLSNPIVSMKKSADILALQKYNQADFKGSYFLEIDELAKTLNKATNKLSQIEELRKDLVANMSHDIKTPLTMIKAYAEMIRDISFNDDKKRNEHLQIIIQEVDYLDNLVKDMRELSKMQTGNYLLNLSNFDIIKALNLTLDLLKYLIDKNDLKIIIHANSSLIVYADEIKIKQVMANFLSNAIKHSYDGGNIDIYIKQTIDGVSFQVQDYGIGIAKEDLPYIWDRYYKIDKKFQRNIHSSGLGLAICKAILDSHHARYGCKTKKGEGSLFYFELLQENEL